jgi:uncharacterized membrane protein YsdA (DUF1294 family)/cold shock CspA family protein
MKNPEPIPMESHLLSGTLKTWKDHRGFGFIRPKQGGEDIFLHISEIKDSTRRPQVSDIIYYYQGVNKEGKMCARNAFIAGARRKAISQETYHKVVHNNISSFLLYRFIPLLILPVLGSIHFFIAVFNPIPIGLYPLMGWLAYLLYAHDKTCAQKGKRRVPERNLHLIEILGGWTGGLLAQKLLRHKSKKRSYQIEFWLIVTAHQIGWLWWLFFGKVFIQ